MNKSSIDKVFYMVGANKFEDLQSIVNEDNVNLFVNDYEQNLLHIAIAEDAKEIFKYLLYCSIDVNKPDNEGKTPLHYSADHNNYELTKLLLDSKGIEKDKKDQFGNNALWVAVFNARGYYDVVKLLKTNGLDAYSKNKSNRSALDFAKQIEDEELEQILLS